MRRLAIAAALALALAASAAGGAAHARTAAPTFIQVTEKEWQITLSRANVKAGTVFVEVLNFGTDAHDLLVQRAAKGAKPVRFSLLDPSARAERKLRLVAGRYQLWCSLPGHRARGMRSTLVVRA